MLLNAGFVDPIVRDKGACRFGSACKPSEWPPTRAHRDQHQALSKR